MENPNEYFDEIYRNFNDRKIDLVVKKMTDNVKWANGMEGGFVYGKEAVLDYWTRQFKMVSSKVTPIEIEAGQQEVFVKVHQVVHDLEGKLLADEITGHIFQLENDKIAVFTIADK